MSNEACDGNSGQLPSPLDVSFLVMCSLQSSWTIHEIHEHLQRTCKLFAKYLITPSMDISGTCGTRISNVVQAASSHVPGKE